MACTGCYNEVECRNTTSWGRRILVSVAGFAFLLCVCHFKTNIYGRNAMKLSSSDVSARNGHLNRHLLEDKHSDTKCVHLHSVNSSYLCAFVKTTEDCQIQDGFIQYIQFPYCTLSRTEALAFVLMILWLIFLFIFVGITADDYFCPALTVISNALNLSPNVAGVTFLAYGNGAPDIFSAVAAFVNSNGTGDLALSALIGAGMFVTTIVVGVVSLSVTYDLNQRPYLRDVVFYLGALAWTLIIVYRKKIDFPQAIGFIVLYIVYVLVVIIGRVIYQRYKRRMRAQRRTIQEDFESSYQNGAVCQGSSGRSEEDFEKSIPVITDTSRSSSWRFNPQRSDPDITTPLLANTPGLTSGQDKGFLKELLSFSNSDFIDSGLLRKMYTIIKIPINLCLNLTIPVVELSAEKHNWNKWLQILQCLFMPLFCVFATKGGFIMLGGKFPLAALMAIVGVILAVTVAITSSKDRPPTYHKLFSFMGFIASVIWIYSTANEIVNLLRMFGVVFKLSNGILGVTLLAWGNSIADFIANLAVAKQGYPQMAIAACFGGPLLNLLLGVGLSCTIATSRSNGTLKLNTGNQDFISTAFLAASLASSAIIVPLVGFRIPKIYGVYLILLYIAFLVVTILNETGVLFS
ncbi:mitochondrial sodium/calcium exchanger protein-like [Dendronephthya gigantea]|uniref:mitochondrial sodium/calcium exchanger protein-like n=1 Tax=Dendronephthya gigantea TaxID=151771 RepID=UPI001068D825|nr:mitochondrial sodium/calcium exchanger protein-like [Dendronephthya gigantea]XP_028400495.1 mitochondrial sodium/calcium exchanger protein-like [Dendronephthya gigantea]XP_028400496.1 mitochondrial sodium/calcium exchanger protein-like [Dendronephthya gigantea]XP_028400497.1 mitochondrial sodium/calcium exchanger protein-like [Dendronephthya gigantea]